MFLFVLLSFCFGQQTYTHTAEVVWELTNTYSSEKWVSWGIFYDHSFHQERLWVKQDTTIDKYEVTSGGAVKVDSLPTGSECKNSETFLFGNKFISTHGNDQYCTCEWTASNPCPHQILVEDSSNELTSDWVGKFDFGPNTVLHMDQVDPDVTGTFGVAEPFDACDPLTNPSMIQGKYCLVTRGSCYFQTKWENCHAAGAKGTIVRNLNENIGWQMWVTAVTTPMVVIPFSQGNALMYAYRDGGNNTDITLSLGRGIGVDSPDPSYVGPDPLVMVNYYTGQKTEDYAARFSTTLGMIYNMHNDFGYFWGVDGSSPALVVVMDMDQSPPTYQGNFTVGQNGQHFFMYQDDNSYLIAMDPWLNSVKFYDMADPINPSYISQLLFDPCSETEIMGEAFVHPSNNILYLTPGINDGSCVSVIRTFDISDLTNIIRLSDISIPEVEVGASLDSISFAPNNLAGIALSSNGVSWYDFTDPLNPLPLGHLDVPEVGNTYTLGVRRVEYGLDGTWYIHDYTEDWHNFHAIVLSANNQASNTDDDDDSPVLGILVWVFLVLLLITTCGCVYFYMKYNQFLVAGFDRLVEIEEKRNPEEGGTNKTVAIEMSP